MNPNESQPDQQPSVPQQPNAPTVQPQVSPYSSPQPNMQSAPQPMSGNMSAPMQPGSKGKMIAIISGVVVFIIVIILLAILLFGHKNNSSSGTSSNGAASSSTATTSKTACQLFTLADAQSVMGPSASAGVSTSTSNESICNYSNQGNIAGINIIVQTNSKSSAVAAAGYNAAKSAVSDATPVSGVGDGAVYSPSTNTLMALKGNVYFSVTVNSQDGSSTQTQAVQVANTMISNF